MSKVMKGLLKGLRYISEIFEADNEKEAEIQIGAPTDVKHVAHIGCDGPSSNAPSWMNEFQGDAGSDNGGSKDSGTSNRHGKSKQSKKQASNKTSNSDNETSRARRTKPSTAGTESPSESGAKKNRRKKRSSNRDPSASNTDE